MPDAPTGPPPPNWGPRPPPPPGLRPVSAPGSPPPAPSPGPAGPRVDSIPLTILLARGIGFLLVFIGTILIVALATVPGWCITSPGSCGTGFAGQAYTAILIGKILWAIGLSSVIAGLGLKIHYELRPSPSARPEELAYLAAERRWNALLIGIGFVLLFLLVAFVNALPPLGPIP